MYKKCGKFAILAVVLILAGSITLSAAYFNGYDFDNLNYNFSRRFSTSSSSNEYAVTTVYEIPYEELNEYAEMTSNFYTPESEKEYRFKNIEIDSSLGNVSIVRGFDFMIQGTYVNREYFEYSFNEKNSTLYVDYSPENFSIFSSEFWNSDWNSDWGTLTITVPDDVYNNVKVKLSGGYLEISNLDIETLELDVTAGTAELTNVNANTSSIIKMTAGNVIYNNSKLASNTLKMTAGEFSFNNCTLIDNTFKLTAGSLYTYDSYITGITKIDMTAGHIYMKMIGNAENYYVTQSKTAGDINLENFGGSSNNSNAENTLDIKVTAGYCNIGINE